MLNIAKLHWAWVFALLIAFIPFIGGLAVGAGACYVWWLISEKRGFPGWYGIMVGLVPIANIIFMGLIAWSEPKK
jgi:hypothetical protein